MVLRIELIGDSAIIERFGTMPEAVQRALRRKIAELTLKLEAKVKVKLSGQVLHVRTGALRSGVFHEFLQEGNTIIGRVATSRTTPYAAIHEFGGTIDHPGGTAWIVFPGEGATFISNAAAEAIEEKFNKVLPRTGPHAIPMPERSYMRSSLADMKDEIIAGLHSAVAKAVEEHLGGISGGGGT